ncbi:alpha/beta hydrolase [Novosphingobium sp. CCH12-A3]|uniref:alpha/beta hydrolase n=1 Tax=Novosphingobium sp. CCH12-A3 TaxID=1768752 RepID=UPI000784BD9D|nr:alpha/beta hydrolase [Novosphingobium sp. CCH12-A3]
MRSYDVENGVVDLGRIKLDVPDTISDEAKAYLRFDPNQQMPEDAHPVPMWQMREPLAPMFEWLNQQALEAYPCTVEETAIDGVRCHRIAPRDGVRHAGKILINLHGGGFVMGSGSLVEAIPMAAETGCEVIAVDYRLAPEYPFPAAVDDIVAVYRDALKTHAARDVILFGTSAGGFLTAMAIMRFKKEGLPLPAACGVFTAGGDVTQLGDTFNYLTLSGFYGHVGAKLDDPLCERGVFVGAADRNDPLLAPIKGDLSDFPPTLLVTGTRDAVLSSAAMFHRALRKAGRDADLHVFEAMPHGFWFSVALPESREAIDLMARFFERHLGIGAT